ncbi:hypothetical protein TI05_13090 [Achromatium sp. WMS3]|nr:hypothetical protein TI05_13090 [Achromatium sp. WMS3]
MQIIRGINKLQPASTPCVATIGNFDGVHIGHQVILKKLLIYGQKLQLPTVVITFEPLPQEYFAASHIPARLTRLREKLQILKELGIDKVLILRFAPKLIDMPAEIFIERILVQALRVQLLLVGDDFRFGKQRLGDFHKLCESGIHYGFQVQKTETITDAAARVSSTRIRQLLSHADLQLAKQLLGRSYKISGRVGYGAKRGRSIGFPTANINLRRQVSPLQGVYAVRIYGIGEQVYLGVANVGQRPTVSTNNFVLLEVHILDFNGDLYRSYLEIEFVHWIRGEQQFASIELLQHQIVQDIDAAIRLFADQNIISQ